MSRTAHHTSTPQPGSARTFRRAWRAAALTDLRYSAACLTEAFDEGRRPRPQATRREVEFYSYPRSVPRDREVARLARVDERRARQALRHDLDAIRRMVNNLATGRLRQYAVDDAEVAPTRHRHGAIWHAW